eukprot:GDKI01042882.1.p1 GENE.GDKI01042882.1~~GDKI01042882.1.p1  ORF type:complete len:292 (-),score=78.85 GDKI01042882.1:109-984(-)
MTTPETCVESSIAKAEQLTAPIAKLWRQFSESCVLLCGQQGSGSLQSLLASQTLLDELDAMPKKLSNLWTRFDPEIKGQRVKLEENDTVAVAVPHPRNWAVGQYCFGKDQGFKSVTWHFRTECGGGCYIGVVERGSDIQGIYNSRSIKKLVPKSYGWWNWGGMVRVNGESKKIVSVNSSSGSSSSTAMAVGTHAAEVAAGAAVAGATTVSVSGDEQQREVFMQPGSEVSLTVDFVTGRLTLHTHAHTHHTVTDEWVIEHIPVCGGESYKAEVNWSSGVCRIRLAGVTVVCV